MPYVENRGFNIHYTVDGDGPLLILQHGLLSHADNWRQAGYVEVLSQTFTVACIDSLGHGKSDKPEDPQTYQQIHRAQDVVAVIDDLGHQQAHLLGYSMGGWIAVGVAKHFPERLASLLIGGWDCVNGLATVRKAMGVDEFTFDQLIQGALQAAPELGEQVTPESIPGMRACFDALEDLDCAARAVCALQVPVTLWDGTQDAYHAPMQAFAEANDFAFLSTPGDHLGAMINEGPQTARKIAGILASAAT